MNHITNRRPFNVQKTNPFTNPIQSKTNLKAGLEPVKPFGVKNKENYPVKVNSKFDLSGKDVKPAVRPKLSGIPVGVKQTSQSGIPLAISRLPLSRRTQNDITRSLSSVQISPKIDDIDKEKNSIFMTTYAADIYNYLRELEVRWSIPRNFMKVHNPSMSGHHRAMIIDWIFRFDSMFDVTPDTYCITASIFDRFVAKESLSREEYQCVGMTSFFIACKFEEVYFPRLIDLVKICENLYSKNDFLKMEMRILTCLKFDIGRPYSLQFLRRYSRAAKAGSRVHTMAKYFCELSLVYYQLAHIKPSILAAAALYLSMRLNAKPKTPSNDEDDPSLWTPTLEHYSTYKRDLLTPYIELLAYTILNNETSKQQECRRKFSDSKYLEVAKLNMTMKKTLGQFASKLSGSPI